MAILGLAQGTDRGYRCASSREGGDKVGVDKHDAVPFLAQRLARLCAGVIKLRPLPDHDRPGADDEDVLDVRSFWHFAYLPRRVRPYGLTRRSIQRRGLRHRHVELGIGKQGKQLACAFHKILNAVEFEHLVQE